MEPNHRPTEFFWTKFLLCICVLSTSSIQFVHCGCRMQDRNPCEAICQWNATRKSNDCNLRVIVILPKKDTVEASLPRVINEIFSVSNSLLFSIESTHVHYIDTSTSVRTDSWIFDKMLINFDFTLIGKCF